MRDRVPLDLLDAVGQAAGERDAAGGDTEQQHVGSAVGPLEDLVGNPGQCPPDLGGFQDRLPVAEHRNAARTISRCWAATPKCCATPGRMHRRHTNSLLPRLTGRALKDSCRMHRISRIARYREGTREDFRPFTGLDRCVASPPGRPGRQSGAYHDECITLRDSCHTGVTIASKTGAMSRIREAETARKPGAAGLPGHVPNLTGRTCGCDETRKLTRFLRFGLTWSRLRPTVTVRNQLLKANTGRGAEDYAI